MRYFTVLRQNGVYICNVDNPSYQVLLIDLDPCLVPVGLHKIIELVELLLVGVDRDFYGFTAFYGITVLMFYSITALCGRCGFLLRRAAAFLDQL